MGSSTTFSLLALQSASDPAAAPRTAFGRFFYVQREGLMPEPQKKIRFDGTINLGHLLTVATFLGACVVGWNAMDKRVTVLEEARIVQKQIDRRQDEEFNDYKRTIREDMRELLRKIDILVERRG
jgi:hypothetical protein